MRVIDALRNALPSVITLAGFACGLAVVLVGDALDEGGVPIRGAILILAAVIFDLLDGAAARTLNAQSAFGRELDSLSDLVCFGVAPATLLHHALAPAYPLTGALAGGAFAVAAAIRLARFNVWSQRPDAALGVSVGLTAPMAACALIAVLLLGPGAAPPKVLGGVAPVLTLLMVSTIPYRTNKGLRPAVALAALAVGASIGTCVAIVEGPAAALATLALGYAASGPVMLAARYVCARSDA